MFGLIKDELTADKILLCPEELNHRRREFSAGLVTAFEILEKLAVKYNWQNYLNEPFIDSFRIFSERESLWQKYREISGEDQIDPPTDGLAAMLSDAVLMAVTPEEYKHLRPEYNTVDNPWPRLLAHELFHLLHIRIAGGEEKMGPKWFYEGFAMYASGQRFVNIKYNSRQEIVNAINADSRGAYAKYEAAFEYFLGKIELQTLISKASEMNFSDWICRYYPQ